MVLLTFAGTSIQLVPDGTLVLHLLVLVLMVALLNRTLFKPINRILTERSLQTEGLADEARKTLAGVNEKLSDYEQKLRTARAEGYRLLEIQKAEAVRERNGQLTAAKAELGEVTADNKRQIANQLELARQSLAADAHRIGLEIGSRILGREIRG